MLRRLLILTALVATLVFGFAAYAIAANPPGTGQPSQSCVDASASLLAVAAKPPSRHVRSGIPFH